MIFKILLIITYQNKNILLLIKLEHPSLCGEGGSLFNFFVILTIYK